MYFRSFMVCRIALVVPSSIYLSNWGSTLNTFSDQEKLRESRSIHLVLFELGILLKSFSFPPSSSDPHPFRFVSSFWDIKSIASYHDFCRPEPPWLTSWWRNIILTWPVWPSWTKHFISKFLPFDQLMEWDKAPYDIYQRNTLIVKLLIDSLPAIAVRIQSSWSCRQVGMDVENSSPLPGIPLE